MRKNYFAKIVKYMKNVYNIEENLNKLTHCRKAPTYKTQLVILLALLGFILRVRSFNELNNIVSDREFVKIVPKRTKLPKIDTIRDTLNLGEF